MLQCNLRYLSVVDVKWWEPRKVRCFMVAVIFSRVGPYRNGSHFCSLMKGTPLSSFTAQAVH